MKRLALIRLLSMIIGGVTLLMTPSLVTALVLGEKAMLRAFLIPLSIGIALALSGAILIRK